MARTIKQKEVEAYIGRPLSTTEVDNLDLYLEIATSRLLDILCLEKLPAPLSKDLTLVLCRLFNLISEENGQLFNIEEKKVEDFTIRFDTDGDSLQARWYKANKLTLDKYSACKAEIIHGETIYDGHWNGRRIGVC